MSKYGPRPADPHWGFYSNATPTLDGREYTPEQVEFMLAMDRYKRENCRPFPTCLEVLRVAKSLGYRKADTCRSIVATT
jgi:hypothetical protein